MLWLKMFSILFSHIDEFWCLCIRWLIVSSFWHFHNVFKCIKCQNKVIIKIIYFLFIKVLFMSRCFQCVCFVCGKIVFKFHVNIIAVILSKQTMCIVARKGLYCLNNRTSDMTWSVDRMIWVYTFQKCKGVPFMMQLLNYDFAISTFE